MLSGGTLREEGHRGRKPEWLREQKRHVRTVKTIDGAARRRENQLNELRRLGASTYVQGGAL